MPDEESKENVEIQAYKLQFESLKAKIESFNEIEKANSERFSQLNERIGEIRGMVMELSKTISKVEVESSKAIDKVEAVQPEKLMLDVRKVDAKVEALKANIESNETMMDQLFEQIKSLRNELSTFKGVDAIVKLSQDVKTDLTNAIKVQTTIERHSDKVESIFMEFQKEFSEFNQLTASYKSLENDLNRVAKQVDLIKMKDEEKASKKEVENLIDKMNKFQGHVSNTLNLITKKSSQADQDIKKLSDQAKEDIKNELQKKTQKINLLMNKFEDMIKNNPEISRIIKLNEGELINEKE